MSQTSLRQGIVLTLFNLIFRDVAQLVARLALGEQAKTTDCCFCDAKSTKQEAVGASASSDARRLCDLTGGVAEDVAGIVATRNIFDLI